MIQGLLPGTEDPTPRRLTPKEMQEWNRFLKYVEQKGYKGSKDLDVRSKGLGASLFESFKKENPDISFGYDIVPSVQYEHQMMAQKARELSARQGNPDADKLYSNNSKVDGWMGSLTSQQYFPEMKLQTKRNGQLVGNENLGLVNGNLMPTGVATPVKRKKKPQYGDAGAVELPDGTMVWEDELPK